MKYVLDSNIISYALKGDVEVRSRMTVAIEKELIIPYIIYFEIKRWLLEINATTKKRMFNDMMCNLLTIEQMDKEVWEEAILLYVQMRKIGQPMSDADLLIAAFCLANNYTLVTNNTQHFEHIAGLQMVNWKD